MNVSLPSREDLNVDRALRPTMVKHHSVKKLTFISFMFKFPPIVPSSCATLVTPGVSTKIALLSLIEMPSGKPIVSRQLSRPSKMFSEEGSTNGLHRFGGDVGSESSQQLTSSSSTNVSKIVISKTQWFYLQVRGFCVSMSSLHALVNNK